MKTTRSFQLGTAAVSGAALIVAVALGFRTAAAPADVVVPAAPRVQWIVAESATGADAAVHDGVVQAVRQTVLAAQVSGAVVALDVKAGDTVKAGQVLMRLDSRAAEQSAAAGAAQVRSARAALEVATRDFERQKLLFEQSYISRAALDRAEAQFKSAQAEAAAQLASAGAAHTQSDFFVIRAPYAGTVSEVPVVLGDMAMPGRPLVTIYDPAALRVSAPIPQTVAARLTPAMQLQIEVPGVAGSRIAGTHWQLLPAVDPATHTQELRVELPASGVSLAPGTFARVWLPGAGEADARVFVPSRSVVKRAELTAVYVATADGCPLLRQVRPGRDDGSRVEILSGLRAGERVAADPLAAGRLD